MPDIQATLEFLADIPLYQIEKPFLALLSPSQLVDRNFPRENLQWEHHDKINIKDVRDDPFNYTIEKCGFQVLQHRSKIESFNLAIDVNMYKMETEMLLKNELGAEHVYCYDLRVNHYITPHSFV